MRVPVGWLGNYVEVPTVDALSSRLTSAGFMTDEVETLRDGSIVLDLEVRQNRPDCLSVHGIAREVSALWETELRDLDVHELTEPADRSERISNDYICFARLRGVTLDRLPQEALDALAQYGQEPTTPLADLSNFVMIEMGQPLHVYTASAVDEDSVRSESGAEGEHLRLLDGREIALKANDLIIRDNTGPLALAGIMGGEASKTRADERDIVVEAGNFRNDVVRRTARNHGIQTEASLRTTKLLPWEGAKIGLERFIALLMLWGSIESIEWWEVGRPRSNASETIPLEMDDVQRIAAISVREERARQVLERLGFHVSINDRTLIVAVPWWRTDIAHPADLIEEIVRVVGYDVISINRLPSSPLRVAHVSDWDRDDEIRDVVAAWGYDEVISGPFVMERPKGGRAAVRAAAVRARNPPVRGQDELRPSLLPNLLASTRFLRFHVPERGIFELGRTFHAESGVPEDRRAVAWVRAEGGAASARNLQHREPLPLRIRSETLALLERLGVDRVAPCIAAAPPFPFWPHATWQFVDRGGDVVALAGVLDHEAYGGRTVRRAAGAEVFVDLTSVERTAFAPQSSSTATQSFDISVVADSSPARVQKGIENILIDQTMAVWLIDVFPLPDGRGARSFTFRVVYDAQLGEPGDVWRHTAESLGRSSHFRVVGACSN